MPNPQNMADLQRQLSSLQSEYYAQPTRMGGNGAGYSDFVRRQTDLANQMMSSQGGAGGAGGGSRQEQNRTQMYDLANGRLDEMRNDPVDAEIMSALRGRATGTDVPFNETTTNAMFTARAEQGAAGQSAAINRLLQSGMSPGDPAFAAAVSEMESNRQGSMQNARMNVDMNAGQQNYAARGGALAQMSGANAQRNGALTSQSNYLSNLYGNETITEQGAGGGGGGMPSFQDFRSGGQQPMGGGQQPQPQPQPQPRPRPVDNRGYVGTAAQRGVVQPQAQPSRPTYGPAMPYSGPAGASILTGMWGPQKQRPMSSGAIASNGGTMGSTYGGGGMTGMPARQPTWTATNRSTGASRTGQNPSPTQSPMVTPVPGRAPPRPALAPQRYTRTMGY